MQYYYLRGAMVVKDGHARHHYNIQSRRFLFVQLLYNGKSMKLLTCLSKQLVCLHRVNQLTWLQQAVKAAYSCAREISLGVLAGFVAGDNLWPSKNVCTPYLPQWFKLICFGDYYSYRVLGLQGMITQGFTLCNHRGCGRSYTPPQTVFKWGYCRLLILRYKHLFFSFS